MDVPPDQCIQMQIYLLDSCTLLDSVEAPWSTQPACTDSFCLQFSPLQTAALIILVYVMGFPKWKSLLGHQVYAVFIYTDYFYKRLEFLLPLMVMCERATPLSAPDPYQLLLFYQANAYIHIPFFFLSLSLAERK